MNVLLWIIQVLLALLFLFAGGTKLVLPIEVLTAQGPPTQVHLPQWFFWFIGICEVLGALGLILPGAFKIKRGLTPIAAVGLVIILIGAVVTSIMTGIVSTAILPFVACLLSAFVAYGRWRWLQGG